MLIIDSISYRQLIKEFNFFKRERSLVDCQVAKSGIKTLINLE
jgi:hypothetical protein